MKARATIEFDMDTGDYEIKFNNVSNPGEPMELAELQEMLGKIVKDFYLQLENSDELPEGFYEATN